MLYLIYNAFPYGKAETFAEYEIPYLNEITGNQYRIISFYNGKDFKSKRNLDIHGEVFTVKATLKDYFKSALSLFPVRILKELKHIKKRSSGDSFCKCLWRVLYYRACGYALLKKAKIIGASDSDTFISYWLNECAYSAVMLKKKYKNIKAVSRAHGFDVFEERYFLPFRSEVFEKLDCVFPINSFEKQYILERYAGIIPDERIMVSHLGINLPDSFSRTADRTVFSIVTCSSIIPLKRLDLMVDALSEIKDFGFRWIHIGGGPLEEQIKELAAEKLCAPNQNYEFIGQLPLSQVHGFYREHDVSLFVNCSDTEGVPVSIMEAMSYGIPAVARDVGGNSEIVDTGNGILVKADCTASDIAEAIRSIYSLSDNDYTVMRQAAREKVENEFNADKQYPSFFNGVMKPAAG